MEIGHDTATGWPLWWRDDAVLEYCPRPDGLSISDAVRDPTVPGFRFVQHTRTQCFDRLAATFDEYSHFGSSLPTLAECSAHNLSPVVEFMWPPADRSVIRYVGSQVAAVCSQDGI